MTKINMVRVIVGGLLAGLIINIGEAIFNIALVRQLWEAALSALGRPAAQNESVIYFILLGFGLGLVMIWIYAAIRPRFGPGPMTAICAGLLVWALAYLYSSAGLLPLHLFPRRLLFYSTVWGFFELPIAALAGAWLYKE
jgi:hypothetical protein